MGITKKIKRSIRKGKSSESVTLPVEGLEKQGVEMNGYIVYEAGSKYLS
ncbi:hypothetical protein [Isobaculum melis]|nr:hypothetical protein [Isobaculum melis]